MTRNLVHWLIALTVSVLMMGAVLAGAARAQDAAGDWHGSLATPAGNVRIGLNIARDAAGVLSGHLISPDQTASPFPLADIKAEGGRLSFAVPIASGRFEGAWDPAGQAWSGTWSQGRSASLVLLRGPVTGPFPTGLRPQVPSKPYPYREDEVSVASVPGVTLACTLTTPAGKGPFAAVVLITGSGAQDRDEALAGHRPFLVLADHLTRRGVAVLRCDDRGFAKSTGDFAQATSADFAVDTEAEAAFLRARPGIDARHVGLIGHSEGGMIAPMVAVKDPKIAFIVLMAGPGAPSRELLVAQRAAIAKANGVEPAALARSEALIAKVNDAVAVATDTASAEAAAARIIQAGAPNLPTAAVGAEAKSLSSPWYRWFIAYDPKVNLAQVKVPILALNGDKDVQVISSLNLPPIREATKANPDVTILELKGLNHLFQTAGTGAQAEYAKIEETISPVALTAISDWVLKHSHKGALK